MSTTESKTSRKSTKVVYGGPFADESTAITAEAQKENPDFEALTANWKTISAGALEYIERVQKPVETPVGDFIRNVVFIEPDVAEEDIIDDILDDEEDVEEKSKK